MGHGTPAVRESLQSLRQLTDAGERLSQHPNLCSGRLLSNGPCQHVEGKSEEPILWEEETNNQSPW